MKHYLLKLSVAVLLMSLAYVVEAQTDSVARSQVAAPVFDSSAIAIPEEGVEDYYAPEGMRKGKRNPIYYFGHDFSTVFLEVTLTAGKNRAIGMTGAYVPEVWGGYLTWQFGNKQWIAGGAEYRLSTPWMKTDWHLFGGLAVGDGVGGEVGVRVAANSFVNRGKLALLSGSAGIRATNEGVYFVGGLSVGLSAVALLTWLMF